ncbi:MAG: PEP-CTERM/exosortase system-associated acyltransferase [Methylobacter sp.]|nr:PEP-CTERM/exosortase system-associated acyltransferase [Methylobacter sp.]
MANNIIAHFNEYFEMIPATSAELKNEVYKLRYQVYCIENKFLNSEDYPDNLEVDDFDPQSVHYLIRHRKSGEYAATVRLILPDTDNPDILFPLELHCEIDDFSIMQSINRKQLGEVSRFCVSKAFKKRKHEVNTLETINTTWPDYFTLNERRTFPHIITLALISCFIKASHENDIHYLFASMEPSFFRFVLPLGITLIKIGPLVDYHGNRWPAVIKITDILEGVAEKKPDIWNLLTNEGCFEQTRPIEKPDKTLGSNSWVG